MTDQKRVGLQQRREARGMGQADLAEAVDVAVRTVRAWEAGKHRPHTAYFPKLMTALGIDELDELFALLDTPPRTAGGQSTVSAAHRLPAGNHDGPGVPASRPGAVRYVSALVAELHRDYQAARYDDVGRALPDTSRKVAELVDTVSGDAYRRALGLRCDVAIVQAKLATKVGDGITAYEAAERALVAAEEAEYPIGHAAASYQLTCALLRLNAPDDAEPMPSMPPTTFAGTIRTASACVGR